MENHSSSRGDCAERRWADGHTVGRQSAQAEGWDGTAGNQEVGQILNAVIYWSEQLIHVPF
jgi:hypothetical protein